MSELGTRTLNTAQNARQDQESDTRSHTRDKGMRKQVVASVAFDAGTGRVAGSNGTFTNTFAVGDPVLVQGVNLNNGFYEVTGLDAANAAYLVLNPPPKNEGPVTAILRTP